jgi:hypothetical protein
MRLVLTLTFLACTTGISQDDTQPPQVLASRTDLQLNGRAWNSWLAPLKSMYIAGLVDSLLWKHANGELQPGTRMLFKPEKLYDNGLPWASGFANIDYIHELDSFYKESANLRIPIPMAFDFCTIKLKGQTKKDDLEAQLMFLRRVVSDLK